MKPISHIENCKSSSAVYKLWTISPKCGEFYRNINRRLNKSKAKQYWLFPVWKYWFVLSKREYSISLQFPVYLGTLSDHYFHRFFTKNLPKEHWCRRITGHWPHVDMIWCMESSLFADQCHATHPQLSHQYAFTCWLYWQLPHFVITFYCVNKPPVLEKHLFSSVVSTIPSHFSTCSFSIIVTSMMY